MVTEAGAVPELAVLVEHSLGLGSDPRLIQGAGGNLSVKSGGVMWIKASGTRLGEAADRQIFVAMDEARTREAVLVTEDLASCVLPDQGGTLRPSIEAALHVLLPHRFVFHAHAVGTISAGLGENVGDLVTTLPSTFDTVVIPYAKPGVELARAVLAADVPAYVPGRPLVLVLRNHGIVVGCDDADLAVQTLIHVDEHFRGAPAPVQGGSSLLATAPGYDLVFGAGTVDERACAVLCAGPLTPDSVVFLGPRPFGRGESDPERHHSALVRDDGSVVVPEDLGVDEREIVVSLVDIARQPAGRTSVTALDDAQADVLTDWEAEKWRRQLKR